MVYIKLCIVLAAFAFIAYYLKKNVQKRQFSQVSQKNIIQIVDGVQVTMGNNMYLTKIGEEYVLVAMGSNGVNMLKLEQTEFVDPKEQFDAMFGQENPTVALNSLTKSVKDRLWKNEK